MGKCKRCDKKTTLTNSITDDLCEECVKCGHCGSEDMDKIGAGVWRCQDCNKKCDLNWTGQVV